VYPIGHRGACCTKTVERLARCTRFSDRNVTVSRSSNAGAGGISPSEPNLVKPCVAVLSALPVVAISTSWRRLGLVTLSPRLSVIRAELRCLHRHASRAKRMALIRHVLDGVINATDARTLLIEDEGASPRTVHLARSSIVAWAEERGVSVVRMSCARACHTICGTPELRAAAEGIASRYSRLASEVLFEDGSIRCGTERWKVRTPLITAFVLAHAFASHSVVNAFGGLIPPHPSSRKYD